MITVYPFSNYDINNSHSPNFFKASNWLESRVWMFLHSFRFICLPQNFITNQRKQTAKTRGSSMKCCFNLKRHHVKLSYILMPIKYYCLKICVINKNKTTANTLIKKWTMTKTDFCFKFYSKLYIRQISPFESVPLPSNLILKDDLSILLRLLNIYYGVTAQRRLGSCLNF